VIWTTPGGNSPERRLTARILKPLLSGARSPKLTGAGSPNTVPNRRLVSGGISWRRQQEAQRVNEVSLRAVGVDLSGGQLRVRRQLSRGIGGDHLHRLFGNLLGQGGVLSEPARRLALSPEPKPTTWLN
jgi:hypothetical protein